MSNAYRDENNTPTAIAVSASDGVTIDRIKVNPASHALKIMDGNTGTDFGTLNAKIDENGVHCLMGVSSVDFKTPTVIYTDGSGNLLVQSS